MIPKPKIISLVNATDNAVVFQESEAIQQVVLNKLSVATEIQVRFGRDAQLITMKEGDSYEADENDTDGIESGLFVTAAAFGAGAAAEFVIIPLVKRGGRAPAARPVR